MVERSSWRTGLPFQALEEAKKEGGKKSYFSSMTKSNFLKEKMYQNLQKCLASITPNSVILLQNEFI